MDNGPMKQEVRFRFEVRPDRPPPLVVHGSVGGITQAGTVVAHLYSEYSALPEGERLVAKEGKVVSLNPVAADRSVIREIHSTLMMPPEVAISVGQWLLGHGQNALSIRNDQQGE